jgi:hypothetical protein
MFNDMALSNDINEKFKEYLEIKSLSNGLDFNILILTAGSWPLTAQSATFNVPQEVPPARAIVCVCAFGLRRVRVRLSLTRVVCLSIAHSWRGV